MKLCDEMISQRKAKRWPQKSGKNHEIANAALTNLRLFKRISVEER